jgi:acyl dehydratase
MASIIIAESVAFFSGGVGKLLDGLNGVFQKPVLPGSEVRAGPVAVDPLYAGDSVFGNLV